MKKTFKTMLALMAGAMTFTGCTSDILENTPEQIPSALKPMTFTATQESDATRAAIVGTAINWTEGDKISIFDGGEADEDGNLAREFALTDGENTPSGTFEGTAATASTYYALYPYASSSKTGVPTREEAVAAAGTYEMYFGAWEAMWGNDRVVGDINAAEISQENKAIILAYFNNESITTKSGPQLNAGKIEDVAFPAAQTATVGTADPKAMLMIGTSDDTNNIQFKNVCAYLKVTPTFACSSIVLKSNGTESLAGTVTLDYNDGNPTTTVTNGTNTVTLSGTIAANSTCYIAVLPATLESGFTVEFKDASDKVIGSKSTAKKVAFARNKVINLGSFNMYPPEGSNGSATRTGNAEVKWVQLWKDGPKFAEYNVGVTDGKAESYGEYFAWATNIAETQWGSAWRMPTKEELQGLLDNSNCTITWTNNYNGTGIAGRIFTGMGAYSSNSIFLPAAGSNNGSAYKNSNGFYWSSTPNGDYACSLSFSSGISSMYNYGDRVSCYSVRAVLKEAPAPTKGEAEATIGSSAGVKVSWVQLWENGPKFAEYNIGASSATDFGGYFEWNSTDIATTQWGSKWRMPTSEEFTDLLGNCECEWYDDYSDDYYEGVPGLLCRGRGDYEDNSIFLPAAGYYYDGDVNCLGDGGYYWSSTPNGIYGACYLYFRSDKQSVVGSDFGRDSGYSVRAVLNE